jgi:glycosyltransferase involved in cell wall biosynthesis
MQEAPQLIRAPAPSRPGDQPGDADSRPGGRRPAPRRVLHVMRMTAAAGSENHLHALIPELARIGWESELLIPTPDPAALRGVADDFARVCSRVTLMRTRFDASPGLAGRLARQVRSGSYEVLHTHLVHADWHGALGALVAPDVALVSSKHNTDPFRLRLPVRIGERLACERCDEVIAISEAQREFTLRWSRPSSPVTTIRYGLSAPVPPAERAEPADPTILAVGRLVPQKGFDVLLHALARLLEAAPRTRLLIAGEGGDGPELEALARRLGVDGAVSFLGRREDVPELMRRAWLLVHPARWEGFGLVFLEAMRERLAVVATGVGPVPDIVSDGVTGRLVPPEDPDALAAAIAGLLADEGARRRAGEAGYARLAERFSPERMARETAAVYERAVGGRSRHTDVARAGAR